MIAETKDICTCLAPARRRNFFIAIDKYIPTTAVVLKKPRVLNNKITVHKRGNGEFASELTDVNKKQPMNPPTFKSQILFRSFYSPALYTDFSQQNLSKYDKQK